MIYQDKCVVINIFLKRRDKKNFSLFFNKKNVIINEF